jgi:hypothetical protein
MNHAVPPCTDYAAAQEAAEAYVLKRLSVSDYERYEEHLLLCPRCQEAVEEFDVFLSAARAALGDLPRERKPRRAAKPRVKSASC